MVVVFDRDKWADKLQVMINCKLQQMEKNQRKLKCVSLERSLTKDQKTDEEILRFVNTSRNILG